MRRLLEPGLRITVRACNRCVGVIVIVVGTEIILATKSLAYCGEAEFVLLSLTSTS